MKVADWVDEKCGATCNGTVHGPRWQYRDALIEAVKGLRSYRDRHKCSNSEAFWDTFEAWVSNFLKGLDDDGA
jgi:hypothetical protein